MTYSYNELVDLIVKNNVPYDKHYTVSIHRDYDSECPRNWDNVGIIYAPNSKYLNNEWESESKPSENEYWIFPISTYDHSGVSFDLDTPQDSWDSWCDARLLIPKSEYPDGHTARNVALGELQTLNQWNSGEVWYFSIVDQFGKFVDGCGGFYSKEELESYCDFQQYNIKKEEFEQAWDNRFE